MRKIIRTIIIFWGILALFPALIIGYLFITTYGHSYDGGASATIWNDENGNGIRDEDEIGLPNVCIAEGLPEWGADYVIERCKENIHDHSDENGEWSRFLPGGKCEDTYLFVEIPSGFQPTTNLASNSCNAEFGFTPKKSIVTQNIQSIEQFIQQYYLFLWIRRIAIGLFILFVCIFGTIWLQKEPKRE